MNTDAVKSDHELQNGFDTKMGCLDVSRNGIIFVTNFLISLNALLYRIGLVNIMIYIRQLTYSSLRV
jgi:hypothetical protein